MTSEYSIILAIIESKSGEDEKKPQVTDGCRTLTAVNRIAGMR